MVKVTLSFIRLPALPLPDADDMTCQLLMKPAGHPATTTLGVWIAERERWENTYANMEPGDVEAWAILPSAGVICAALDKGKTDG